MKRITNTTLLLVILLGLVNILSVRMSAQEGETKRPSWMASSGDVHKNMHMPKIKSRCNKLVEAIHDHQFDYLIELLTISDDEIELLNEACFQDIFGSYAAESDERDRNVHLIRQYFAPDHSWVLSKSLIEVDVQDFEMVQHESCGQSLSSCTVEVSFSLNGRPHKMRLHNFYTWKRVTFCDRIELIEGFDLLPETLTISRGPTGGFFADEVSVVFDRQLISYAFLISTSFRGLQDWVNNAETWAFEVESFDNSLKKIVLRQGRLFLHLEPINLGSVYSIYASENSALNGGASEKCGSIQIVQLPSGLQSVEFTFNHISNSLFNELVGLSKLGAKRIEMAVVMDPRTGMVHSYDIPVRKGGTANLVSFEAESGPQFSHSPFEVTKFQEVRVDGKEKSSRVKYNNVRYDVNYEPDYLIQRIQESDSLPKDGSGKTYFRQTYPATMDFKYDDDVLVGGELVAKSADGKIGDQRTFDVSLHPGIRSFSVDKMLFWPVLRKMRSRNPVHLRDW